MLFLGGSAGGAHPGPQSGLHLSAAGVPSHRGRSSDLHGRPPGAGRGWGDGMRTFRDHVWSIDQLASDHFRDGKITKCLEEIHL